MRDNTDTGKVLGDYALSPSGLSQSARSVALRVPAAIAPSKTFIALTRNPSLEPPSRFEPKKREGEFVEIVPDYARFR